VIEMMSTLETVQAEIDYRRRAARQGIDLENMRAARQAHRSLWRRLRAH
jgi:hypothetical protein